MEHRPKIVFLTSPNNPDGSIISEVPVPQPVLAMPAAESQRPQSCRGWPQDCTRTLYGTSASQLAWRTRTMNAPSVQP